MKPTKAAYFLLFTIGVAGCGGQPDGGDGNVAPGTSEELGVETQKVYNLPFYRFYNSSVNRHFYTTDFYEGARVGYPGYEGSAGLCEPNPAPNRKPLQRLYHRQTGGWFYSIDQGEINVALTQGWESRPMATPCYVTWTQEPGTCPMYRLWYGRSWDHFYTQSWREVQSARNSFYQYEGVGFYLASPGNGCPQ